ncbi:hypothetical protein [Deinococcus cellulosilyticus]|uniref:Uncharacterized protein n=1 Tax=Deinococcus cellulosilyticus (strain DSM 18568 / NBRC 106333 / KACC 11606 / 5516J-15) TaxID=1223518 RepID=A0A511N5H8_DEIC1|nr:hypothetical protein [Deinococcus cellulosilyticus]GEM47727.1 hypothetical protein DC3_33620 [Deinococcus cellulosilyticus NBRC 106333 = KACC 11606]
MNAGGKGEVQAKTVAVVNAEGLITQEQSLYPEGSRSIVWYTYSPEGNLLSMAEDFLFPGEVPDPKQLPKPEFTLVWEQGKPIRKELGGTGMISSAEHYTHEGSGLKTLIRETITFKDVISTIDKVLISSTLSPHKAGGFVVVNLYQEFKQQKPGPVLPLSECRYSSEGWLLSKVIQPTAEHAGERLTYIYPRVSEGVWLERQEQYELFNTQGVLRRSPINVIVRNLIRNSTP